MTRTLAVAFVLWPFLLFPSAASGAGMLDRLTNLAVGVWGMPPCGHPQGFVSGIDEETAGIAYRDSCEFFIAPDVADSRIDDDRLVYYCNTVVHEVGHLALGPAFAAENPSDPWHAASGVMASFGGNTAVCYRFALRVERERAKRARARHRVH